MSEKNEKMKNLEYYIRDFSDSISFKEEFSKEEIIKFKKLIKELDKKIDEKLELIEGNRRRKKLQKRNDKSDKKLRIKTYSKEDKKKLKELSKDEFEKRKQIAIDYLVKYGKYSEYKMKSSDIAVKINKEIFEKTGKYPDPLYADINLRALLAWIKMRINKEKEKQEKEDSRFGWSKDRWEEERKKAIDKMEQENKEEPKINDILDSINSKSRLNKLI